jgi:hypothetical protein
MEWNMGTTLEKLESLIVRSKIDKVATAVEVSPELLLPYGTGENKTESLYKKAKDVYETLQDSFKSKDDKKDIEKQNRMLGKAKAVVDYLRDQSLLYCIEQPNNLFFNYLRRQKIDFNSPFANGTTPLTLKGKALAEGTTPVEYASSLGNEHFVTKVNINNQPSVTEGIDLFGLLNEKQRIEARRGQARLDHQVAVANERERYVTEAGELLTNMVITTP